MPIVLKSVIPWGRSYEEYIAMFSLTPDDLGRSILGCGDGPAGFNARMYRAGHRAVSCDPLYRYTLDEIRLAIEAARKEIMPQVRNNPGNFVWKTFRSPDELEQERMAAMGEFLGDYESGIRVGRYVAATLPTLPFRDRAFDLCLCSHFLFLYDSLGPDFHLRSIRELARVGAEVRIYPVINLECRHPEFFGEVTGKLREEGLAVSIFRSGYGFWKNGHEGLKISRTGM